MTQIEPAIYCKMLRLEALEGPTDFQVQLSCSVGESVEHLGLDGSDFQIDRDLFTVIPLELSYTVTRILALKSSSGYQSDDETFLRAFASAVVDMLRRDGTMFDQSTLVVMSEDQATLLGISRRADYGIGPQPFEGHVILARRFSKADHFVCPDQSASE